MKSRWNVTVVAVALATTALSMLGGSVPVVAGPVTRAGASASVPLVIDPLGDADQVVRAWGRGDRAAVEVLATPSVTTDRQVRDGSAARRCRRRVPCQKRR